MQGVAHTEDSPDSPKSGKISWQLETNAMKVKFYFDFLSPFSFFAWRELHRLPPETEIEFLPVPLGPLLNHWGIKGPGEVQPKREFLLKQMLRKSVREGFAFTTPKTHPFNSLYSLRLALKGVAGDLQLKVIKTLWEAGWQERIDMGEPDELQRVLAKAELPAVELYEKSFTPEAKKELKANLATALAAGVFGVPSFVAQDELFWGHDSMSELTSYIKGEDILDRQKLTRLLAETPRAQGQSL
jgi:2-hydroxychromene-2-carboxylate isomerase